MMIWSQVVTLSSLLILAREAEPLLRPPPSIGASPAPQSSDAVTSPSQVADSIHSRAQGVFYELKKSSLLSSSPPTIDDTASNLSPLSEVIFASSARAADSNGSFASLDLTNDFRVHDSPLKMQVFGEAVVPSPSPGPLNQTNDTAASHSHEEQTVEEKWLGAANVINSLTNSLIKTIVPLWSELMFAKAPSPPPSNSPAYISPVCLRSLVHLVSGIRENRRWALSFIDSSGHIPSGLLTGTLTDLGDYDECRSIQVTTATQVDGESMDDDTVQVTTGDDDSLLFSGAYCLAKFRPSLPHPPPDDITMDDTVISFNSSSLFAPLLGTVFEDASRLAQGFYSLPIHIAVCVPSTCSGDEVTSLLSRLVSPLHMTVSLDGDACDSYDDSPTLTVHQVISLIVLTIICLTVICCSLVDKMTIFSILRKRRPSSHLHSGPVDSSSDSRDKKVSSRCVTCGLASDTRVQVIGSPVDFVNSSSVTIISCSDSPCNKAQDHQTPPDESVASVIVESFSITRNVNKLFKGNASTSDSRIHFIHGTRVLTITWIVVCHTYTFGTQFLVSTGSVRIEEDIRPKRREFLMQFIINGWFSVETFFFLSGFILVYIVHPIFCKAKGKLSFVSYVTLRWLRFSPSLLGLLIIHFLWPLLGSGPVFKSHTRQLLRACYQGWWKNLLYINNFEHHHNDICMKHTWYIAADFQLHVIAFISLWLLYWHKRHAYIFNGLMISLGMIIPAAVVYYFALPPTLVASTPYIEKFEALFGYFYFPTYNHLTPYFLGVVTGYFVTSDGHLTISKRVRSILWFALSTASVCIVLSTVAWNRYGLPIEPVSSTIYAATHRLIWCLFIMWLAVSSSSQKTGTVHKLLSSSLWLPLSRLSFQIYLVHFTVIYFHFLTQRKPLPFTHYDRLFMSCGTMVISVLGALVTFCLFEAPFASLVKKLIIDKKVRTNDTAVHGQATKGDSYVLRDSNRQSDQ